MGAAASSKKKRRSLSAAQRVSPSDTEQVAHSLSNVESVESGGGGSGGSGGSIASSVARGTPESRPLQAKLVEAASGRADLDWTRLPSAGPAPLGSHIGAPMPPDEALRLATLHSYRVLDTERNDKVLDSITATLADSLGVEVSVARYVPQACGACQRCLWLTRRHCASSFASVMIRLHSFHWWTKIGNGSRARWA